MGERRNRFWGALLAFVVFFCCFVVPVEASSLYDYIETIASHEGRFRDTPALAKLYHRVSDISKDLGFLVKEEGEVIFDKEANSLSSTRRLHVTSKRPVTDDELPVLFVAKLHITNASNNSPLLESTSGVASLLYMMDHCLEEEAFPIEFLFVAGNLSDSLATFLEGKAYREIIFLDGMVLGKTPFALEGGKNTSILRREGAFSDDVTFLPPPDKTATIGYISSSFCERFSLTYLFFAEDVTDDYQIVYPALSLPGDKKKDTCELLEKDDSSLANTEGFLEKVLLLFVKEAIVPTTEEVSEEETLLWESSASEIQEETLPATTFVETSAQESIVYAVSVNDPFSLHALFIGLLSLVGFFSSISLLSVLIVRSRRKKRFLW